MVLAGAVLAMVAVGSQAIALSSGWVVPLAFFLPGFFITMAQGISMPYGQAAAMAEIPRLAGTAAGVGVFMLLGLPMVILMVFQIRNELSILKYGKVTNAEVLSTVYRKPSRKSRGGEGLIIAYRYTGDSGKSYLNESFTRDLSLLQTIKQGDVINIFVSHTDESRSTLVNRLESVRNNWNIG